MENESIAQVPAGPVIDASILSALAAAAAALGVGQGPEP